MLNLIFLVFSFIICFSQIQIDASQPGANNQNNHDYEQGQAFYQKLCDKDPALAGESVQVYYKKIDPVVSNPQPGHDRWSAPIVTIAGNIVRPGLDGTYRHEGISFRINNPTQEVALSIISDDIIDQVNSEKKEPSLPTLKRYNSLKNSAFIAGGLWRKKIFLDATLQNPEGQSFDIKIESRNERCNPIKVQGMAVVYNKDAQSTKIFFDFADTAGRSIDYSTP